MSLEGSRLRRGGTDCILGSSNTLLGRWAKVGMVGDRERGTGSLGKLCGY